jgi:Na+-translocating ferredoxin:NAD+ oxidoreductase RNF subunit RnfB
MPPEARCARAGYGDCTPCARAGYGDCTPAGGRRRHKEREMGKVIDLRRLNAMPKSMVNRLARIERYKAQVQRLNDMTYAYCATARPKPLRSSKVREAN